MKPANYLILATALSLFSAVAAVSGAQITPSGQILDPAVVALPRSSCLLEDGHYQVGPIFLDV